MSKRRTALKGSLGCAVLLGGGLLGGLAALPLLAEGPVLREVERQADAQLDGTLRFGGGGLHIWRSFPQATVWLDEVRLTGEGDFAEVTLLEADRVEVKLDLMSALGSGPLRVEGLAASGVDLRVLVLEDGRSNYEALLPASEEDPAAAAEGSTELWLRDLAITDLSLTYEDREGDLEVDLVDLDLTGDAEVEAEVLALRPKATIASLSVRQGGVHLLEEAKVEGDLDLRYSPETGALQFGDSRLGLNALAVGFSGKVLPQGAGTELDLAFQSNDATFKSVLSLVPSAYTQDFASVDADGTFRLGGTVKGLLPDEGEDLPGFDLALEVGKGRFAYPGLPSKVDGIELSASFKHPGGDLDGLVVDIPRFGLSVDGQTLSGRLALAHPTTDPEVDLAAKGGLDVGKLIAAFPQDDFTARGRMSVDLEVKGRASDLEAARVDAVTARGQVRLEDVHYEADDQPVAYHIEDLELDLDPRSLDLTSFRVRFGESDISATGEIDNTLGWLFADQVLKGDFTVTASRLDTRPFEGEDEGEDEGSGVYVLPEDLDLSAQVDLRDVVTQDYRFQQVRGRASLKDGVLRLSRLRADTLGGSVELDGTYEARTSKEALVDMQIDAQSVAISEVVSTFETIREMLPIAQSATGNVGTTLAFKTKLGPDYSPDLMTLFSKGVFTTRDTELSPSFLGPVASFAGSKGMERMVLSNQRSDFVIDAGKLRLEELPVEVGVAAGVLAGVAGVADGTLDLTLDLSAPAGALSGVEGLQALGDAGAKVGLQAKITGTWDKPKVKVGLKQSLADTARTLVEDAVSEKVEELVGDARAELVAQATAQGDKLVAEAEAAADKLRSEASKQGDKLVKEAEKQADKLVKEAGKNPVAKAAAEKAGEKLVKEARKKANQLEKEADKQGDKLVGEAKEQRAKLIAEAKSR